MYVYCVCIGVHVCALQRVYVFMGAGIVEDYIRKGYVLLMGQGTECDLVDNNCHQGSQ